ncbi:MAG TPA: molybdopterin-dependent oxidoreductase [Planctomycetaceae bacterium]|jgi:anaerobic selenocysteine-containing dehydrogenase|nr:molybdopterin-dependent oxidoreductase [Planctomycetaceae bacterium]
MSGSRLEVVTSACPLDCPDSCSLDVTIRDGRVEALDGNRLNPITAGFICGKVRHFAELMYGDDRVLYPAVRSGPKGSGKFRRVSWDEALERVATRLADVRDESGGEAILPYCYGGSNGWLTQNGLDARFFHRLGASRLDRTLCAMPAATASMGLYGKMPGVAYEDYPAARLIVLWGVNPAVTGIHLAPFIRQAQANGAKLVVIDPRRTQFARQAELHLALRPGSDLPVALAIIRWLFASGRANLGFLTAHARNWEQLRERSQEWTWERSSEVAGIHADQIAALAELYADSRPAVIRCGWGLERNQNGGSAIAAVLALPAVAGKFGIPGGGFTMSQSFAWDVDAMAGAAAPPPATRVINMNRLGETLRPEFRPPVRVLFVYNCNPMSTVPEQNKIREGLMRDDLFTVVHEQVLTDTARYADVLLPATTFLEHAELRRSYGAMLAQFSQPVVDPVGEARSNHWLFGELCRRLELTRPGDPETPEELVRAIVATSSSSAQLAESFAATGRAIPPCGQRPVPFVDVFPGTADRRIDLCPKLLDQATSQGLYAYLPVPAREEFPLTLISPSTSKAISSTLYQLVRAPVPVEMHPDDARERGIADGDAVRIFNDSGEVRCTAKLNADLRPGLASLPKGLWARHTHNGQTANALAPDTLSDLGGGACFNDSRVQIKRAPLNAAAAITTS